MTEFVYPMRIYFDDTDALGIAYHANYLKFMERARSEWLEQAGCGLDWQRRHGIGFVIQTAQIKWLQPAKLHEQVEVVSRIAKRGGASVLFDQHLRFKETPDKILCTAEIKIVCVNDKMHPCPLPRITRDLDWEIKKVNYDASLISYFIHASIVVKCVMLILAGASVFSWSYIFQRSVYLKDMRNSSGKFEQAFWSGDDLSRLYTESSRYNTGMDAIFNAGYKEYMRFRKLPQTDTEAVVDNAQRAMKAAQMREQDKLETHLSFLAIVGSTSPYVGLFGTVWGIMQAFRALANVQQASIAMVAPGIAEALIATALGLFAAIPAVIAYNRFTNDINKLMGRFDAFQEEFTNILTRERHQSSHSPLQAVEQ